eukprot:2709353-Rhodomonas_salina.1
MAYSKLLRGVQYEQAATSVRGLRRQVSSPMPLASTPARPVCSYVTAGMLLRHGQYAPMARIV